MSPRRPAPAASRAPTPRLTAVVRRSAWRRVRIAIAGYAGLASVIGDVGRLGFACLTLGVVLSVGASAADAATPPPAEAARADARAAGTGDAVDAATLDALLRDLRELRTARRKLATDWNEEQDALARQQRLDEATDDAARVDLQRLNSDLTTVRTEHQAATDDLAAADTANAAVATLVEGLARQWTASANAADASAPRPSTSETASLALGDDVGRDLRVALDPTAPLDLRVAALLNAMGAAVNQSVSVASRRAVVTLDGADVELDILRLGGALEYGVTQDNSRAAVRTSANAGTWQTLPAGDAAAIRQAIDIAARTAPAALTALPLPAGAVTQTAGSTP